MYNWCMELNKLLSPFRRAVNDYKMILPGDKIAVGVSGGKDSLTLLALLAAYQRHFGVPFELLAVTVDMGFANCSFDAIARYCDDLGVEYCTVKTELAQIIFEIRKESNPCSLCAKMRRGALNGEVVRRGFNKLALGHHRDDVAETFLLSLFYEGRLSTFQPTSFMSRSGVTLIRPMIYIAERDIVSFAKDLPVAFNPCPANHNTERENMKRILQQLREFKPDVEERLANAIMHPERYNLWSKPQD